MNAHRWILFAALSILALLAARVDNSTDYAIFITGAFLLWGLAPNKKEK